MGQTKDINEMLMSSNAQIGLKINFPDIANESWCVLNQKYRTKHIPATWVAIVVDDNTTICNSTAALVTKLGFNALPMKRVEEVIKYVKNNKIDLLLTDFDMPTLNGVQLGYLVKKRCPGTKVIIMTGHCQAELVPFAKNDIISAWLFKPFGLKELTSSFRNIGFVAGF